MLSSNCLPEQSQAAVASRNRITRRRFSHAPVLVLYPLLSGGIAQAQVQSQVKGAFCYLSSSSTAGSRTTTGRTIKSPVGSQTADTRFPHLRATTGAHHPERPLLGKPLYCHRQQDRRKEGGVCKQI